MFVCNEYTYKYKLCTKCGNFRLENHLTSKTEFKKDDNFYIVTCTTASFVDPKASWVPGFGPSCPPPP